MCNPEQGFRLTNPKDIIDWWMYCSWEKGIAPQDFRQSWMKDVRRIMRIKSAIDEKNMRESQIRKMMSKVKW